MLCKECPELLPCTTPDGTDCYGAKLWGGGGRVMPVRLISRCKYPEKAKEAAMRGYKRRNMQAAQPKGQPVKQANLINMGGGYE
jgi:hypothetical protein